MRETTGPLGVTAIKNGSTYAYLVRDPAGTLLSASDGTNVVNYVTEPNGNITWIVAPWGSRTGAYKYAPYGKTTAYGTAAETNRYRWLGAAQNTTGTGGDGHYKLGARYYDTQAHFTQADPVAGGLGDPRTLTRYNYAGGDPINQADPNGYFFDEIGKAFDVYDIGRIGFSVLNGNYRDAANQAIGFAAGAVLFAGCAAAAGIGPQAPITAPTLIAGGACIYLSASIGSEVEDLASSVIGSSA